MNIIITGATGFVGRNLIPVLLKNQHQITIVGRSVHKINNIFKENITRLSWSQLNQISPDDFDVIINLAGENIAQNRWTKRSKKLIKESRVNSTMKIVTWCLTAKTKKPHLYNASAIGIYGLQQSGDNLSFTQTESASISFDKPRDFLSEVGQAWENAAMPAVNANFPVTFMRFAVVLKRHEGILKKLELPFSLGLGSVLGDGQQAFTWIHIDDLIRAILFLIDHPEIIGAVNLSAPECISQKSFSEILAHAMHRPLFLKMPARMIKILFGQMGEELLLGGQNVYPERLKQLGFKFLYPNLHLALAHEMK
ncbi:MAG: TIGR01777 family oxidoreductase [Gammaproteobacteria bacterium]